MTTSVWSESEISKQFASCRNLKEIIAKLELDFSTRGEVICEIRVNGMILEESDEEKFAENVREEIRDLAVRSNRPANLIFDAIRSAHAFIPELEKACVFSAELFRGSDLVPAQKGFHETLEGCQWLVETLIHVRGAASGIHEPIAQPERWFEAEKVLSSAIRELSEAYSAQDYVLVADLLEYEVTGALSIWKAAVQNECSRREG